MTGYYSTFVVKIWCDEDEAKTRGYIQHVSSQERVYFRNIEDMMSFMGRHLSPPFNGSATPQGRMIPAEDFGEAG